MSVLKTVMQHILISHDIDQLSYYKKHSIYKLLNRFTGYKSGKKKTSLVFHKYCVCSKITWTLLWQHLVLSQYWLVIWTSHSRLLTGLLCFGGVSM